MELLGDILTLNPPYLRHALFFVAFANVFGCLSFWAHPKLQLEKGLWQATDWLLFLFLRGEI